MITRRSLITGLAATTLFTANAQAQAQADQNLEPLKRSIKIEVAFQKGGIPYFIDFFTLDCEHPLEELIERAYQDTIGAEQDIEIISRAHIYDNTSQGYLGTAPISPKVTIPSTQIKDRSTFESTLKPILFAAHAHHMEVFLENGYKIDPKPDMCMALS